MSIKTFIFVVLVAGLAGGWSVTRSGESPMTTLPQEQQYVFEMAELNRLRAETGKPWLEFLNVPSMYCGVYHLAAGSRDGQSPHADDEVYYVQSGRSKFHMDGQDVAVEPGHVLYVPAGKTHYFHEITEDLTLLVFFARSADHGAPY